MHIEVRAGTDACAFNTSPGWCAGMLIAILAIDLDAEAPERGKVSACEAHRDVAIEKMGVAMHTGVLRNAWAPTTGRAARKAAIRLSMKRPPEFKIIDTTMNDDADVMGPRPTTPAPSVVNFLAAVAKRTLDPRAMNDLKARLGGVSSADARLDIVRATIFPQK